MISTEVPVMFSRILEIFITELTMRSWLHTEDSKRRTVQVASLVDMYSRTEHSTFRNLQLLIDHLYSSCSFVALSLQYLYLYPHKTNSITM